MLDGADASSTFGSSKGTAIRVIDVYSRDEEDV
jgi:hypothetical protein